MEKRPPNGDSFGAPLKETSFGALQQDVARL